MKLAWWKILSVALLLWTFVAGLVVPLHTGITTVTPERAKVGDTLILEVEGYNSHWAKATQAKAWLHIDSFYKVDKEEEVVAFAIESNGFKVLDDRHITFNFVIPRALPVAAKIEQASLLVDVEGAQAIRPMVMTITQDSINTELGRSSWSAKMTANHTWAFKFPYRNILYETIRNTYFHVPMWFVMFTLFGLGVFYCIRYLRSRQPADDIAAVAYTQVGVVFSFLGLFSGALWANFTWGEPFPLDIKLIMTYTCMAIYVAYFILRSSFDNFEQRARISAVYSIFAFAALIPLLYVVPKLSPDSLHPGNGGNPAFGSQDMDNTMRLVFYPASLGWILLGLWMAQLVRRYNLLKEKWLSRG